MSIRIEEILKRMAEDSRYSDTAHGLLAQIVALSSEHKLPPDVFEGRKFGEETAMALRGRGAQIERASYGNGNCVYARILRSRPWSRTRY